MGDNIKNRIIRHIIGREKLICKYDHRIVLTIMRYDNQNLYFRGKIKINNKINKKVNERRIVYTCLMSLESEFP